MNIFDPIERVAREMPQRPAIVTGRLVLSYGDLLSWSAAVALRLRLAGVQRGDVVLITSNQSMAHWMLTLALARLGAASLPMMRGQDAAALAQRCTARAVVLSEDVPEVADGVWLVLREQELLAPLKPNETVEFQTQDCSADDGLRFALSSGTTGSSKVMLWVHGASMATVESAAAVAPFTPADRVLMFMGMNISFAFHHSLRVLAGGATLVLPIGVPSGANLAYHLDMYGVSHVVTSTAVAGGLARALEGRQHQGGVRFPCLRRLVAGGEPMPLATLGYLEREVCPQIISNYGCSEAGLLSQSDRQLRQDRPGATGRLVPGVRARARDEHGVVLAPGEVGLLSFQTPGMVRGYVGELELSARTFQDGWYHSGDIGAVDADGVVTLGTRREEWLQWQGRQLDPMLIEQVINSIPGVTESVVFVGSEAASGTAHLVGMFVATQGVRPQDVRQHCQARLDAQHMPTVLLPVQALPRTKAGKVSRLELGRQIRLKSAVSKPSDSLELVQ